MHLPVADDVGFCDVGGAPVLWVVDGVFHLAAMGLGCALRALLAVGEVLGIVRPGV